MNWYINKKTNELVEVAWSDGKENPECPLGAGWLVTENVVVTKRIHKDDFQSQYGEAMICPDSPNDEPHIRNNQCDIVPCCIPYTPEQKEETVQIEKQKYYCVKCGWIGTDYIFISRRKNGINRYKSALSIEDGFSDPLIACPVCKNPVFEQGKYDVDNEPVFPICGTCNAQKEPILYSLNCEKCGDVYQSNEAFPSRQLCITCKGNADELRVPKPKPDSSLLLSDEEIYEALKDASEGIYIKNGCAVSTIDVKPLLLKELDHLAKLGIVYVYINPFPLSDYSLSVLRNCGIIPLSDYMKGEVK